MRYSIVIPCYRSVLSIRDVVAEIDSQMAAHGEDSYEIVMVNDCSPDGTLNVLKELCDESEKRICVDLAKNSGQHAALMAGFRVSSGDFVITVDDDLQTPVEGIWKLKDKLDEGYDMVCAKYTEKDGVKAGRMLGTKLNRAMMHWLLEVPKDATISVFMIVRRFVIDEIVKYEQPYPFLAGLFMRTTRNIANVEMTQKSRAHGSSGYTLKKLLALWLDGFTAFSLKPLRIADIFGIIAAIAGVILGVVIIIRKIINPGIALGWSSTASIMLIMGGAVMLMLGLIGEYIGRIYICISGSPQSVIKEIYTKR